MAQQLHPPVTTLDVTDGVTTVEDVKEIDVTGATVADGGNGTANLTIAGSQVKVTTNDTTPDFLSNKVTAGAGITLNVLNPSGDEELEIVAAGGGGALAPFNVTTKPIFPGDTQEALIPLPSLSAGVLSDVLTDENAELTFYSQYDVTVPRAGVADPFYQSVLLYLDGEGADEDTSISDLSLVGNTPTFTGGAKLDDAATKFNATTSFYFPGTGTDSVRIPATDDLFNLKSGLFTIEFFFRREGAGGSNARIFANRDGATVAGLLIEDDAGDIKFSASSDGITYDYANGVTIIASATTDEWYHIAIERVRHPDAALDFINVCVDGVIVHTVTLDIFSNELVFWDSGGTARWTLGGSSITSNSLNGRIEQFRTTISNYRYGNNFPVPKSPFGSTFDDSYDPYESQVFFYHPGEGTNGQASIDDIGALQLPTTLFGGMTLSNAQTKFNATTSIQFDGVDDYYEVGTTTDLFLDLSINQTHTTDFWVYFNATGSDEYVIGNFGAGGFGEGYTVHKNTSDQMVLTVYEFGPLSDTLIHSTVLTGGVWYHIHACVDYDMNRLLLAVDGVLEYTDIVNVSSAFWQDDFNIGAVFDSGGLPINFFGGYLEQIRFTFGFNRAGAAVVLPTAPPPLYPIDHDLVGNYVYANITGDGTEGTQDAIVDTSARETPIIVSPNLLQNSTQAVFNDSNTSMEFDNDDTKYIIIPFPPEGINDQWTIELYYYQLATGTEEVLISNKQTGGTTGFELYVSASGRLQITLDGGTSTEGASKLMPPTEWNHISVQGANGTVTVSMAGRNDIYGFGLPLANIGTDPFYIGRRPPGVGTSNPANGFIAEVRFTVNAWRYPFSLLNRRNTNLNDLLPPQTPVPVSTDPTITLGSETVIETIGGTTSQLNQILHNKDSSATNITTLVKNIADNNNPVVLSGNILGI